MDNYFKKFFFNWNPKFNYIFNEILNNLRYMEALRDTLDKLRLKILKWRSIL
jgi:hypothetical protein